MKETKYYTENNEERINSPSTSTIASHRLGGGNVNQGTDVAVIRTPKATALGSIVEDARARQQQHFWLIIIFSLCVLLIVLLVGH